MQWFPGFVPTVPTATVRPSNWKEKSGQEWADRGVSLSARAAISVALAATLHAEQRVGVNRRLAPRFVLVLKVG